MELVHQHHKEHHHKMRFELSQIIVSITFVIVWYSHWFTYDFITPILGFFHGMYLAYQDSTLAVYMQQRTQVLTEARMKGETTIDRLLDIVSKLITFLGGLAIILITPTLQLLGGRIKEYFKKKFATKKKIKKHDDLL